MVSSFASLLLLTCLIACAQAHALRSSRVARARTPLRMFGNSPPPEFAGARTEMAPAEADAEPVSTDKSQTKDPDTVKSGGFMENLFPGGLEVGNILNVALIGYTAYLLIDTVRIIATKGS